MPGLTETVKSDITAFVNAQRELMFNEGDFQLQLAVYLLRSGHYDDLNVEYNIPNELAAQAGYDWDSNLYIDIVCRRSEEYVAIELKYPTRLVVKDARRFGSLLKNVRLMKNQAAQNLVQYNFWKDVRRCEIIKQLFPAVKSGLAVMLTNDPSYTRSIRRDSVSVPFSVAQGVTAGGGTMDWQGPTAMRSKHTPFVLDGRYTVDWTEHTIDNEKFNLLIITI